MGTPIYNGKCENSLGKLKWYPHIRPFAGLGGEKWLPCALQRPLRGEMVAEARPAISWKSGVSKGVIDDRNNARNLGEPSQVMVR